MKYLITNADDYGYRADISKAIVEAHRRGVLTSTTVLINFISLEDVELTKKVPNLGLGLHLNLTSGEPLTKNWKEKYGSFFRPHRNKPQQFDQEEWLPVFTKFRTEDIYLEYEAQIKRFHTLFKKKPTHIDSHHYHSSFPSVLPAFIKIAQKYALAIRQPVIWDVAANQHPMGNIIPQQKLVTEIKKVGIQTTTFFSIKYLNRYDNPLKVLQQELNQIRDGQTIEISFHPGFEEKWRNKDLKILEDPQTKKLLRENNIKLINFSDLNNS